jgi:hypothetical protein
MQHTTLQAIETSLRIVMQTNEWFGACVLWYEKKKNQDEDAGISDCISDCMVKKEETVRHTALKEENERVCSGTVRVMSNGKKKKRQVKTAVTRGWTSEQRDR